MESLPLPTLFCILDLSIENLQPDINFTHRIKLSLSPMISDDIHEDDEVEFCSFFTKSEHNISRVYLSFRCFLYVTFARLLMWFIIFCELYFFVANILIQQNIMLCSTRQVLCDMSYAICPVRRVPDVTGGRQIFQLIVAPNNNMIRKYCVEPHTNPQKFPLRCISKDSIILLHNFILWVFWSHTSQNSWGSVNWQLKLWVQYKDSSNMYMAGADIENWSLSLLSSNKTADVLSSHRCFLKLAIFESKCTRFYGSIATSPDKA